MGCEGEEEEELSIQPHRLNSFLGEALVNKLGPSELSSSESFPS